MPDKARLLPLGGLLDGFNGMHLIGPQQNQLMTLRIHHAVMPHHLMGFGNPQNFLGKFQIIFHRLIVLVNPRSQKTLIEV